MKNRQLSSISIQERFKSITLAYFKGSKGAFIVYDISKINTFRNVRNWINDIKKNGEKDVFIILIGNKNDLLQREVSYEEGIKFAEMYSIYNIINIILFYFILI